jgi:hypothetical protein
MISELLLGKIAGFLFLRHSGVGNGIKAVPGVPGSRVMD